jgi:hypothetical protein
MGAGCAGVDGDDCVAVEGFVFDTGVQSALVLPFLSGIRDNNWGSNY